MTRKRRLAAYSIFLSIVVLIALVDWFVPGLLRRTPRGDGIFEVKPYLQLGNSSQPDPNGSERLVLCWQTLDDAASWLVEVQSDSESAWRLMEPPTSRQVAISGAPAFLLFRAQLRGLAAGEVFRYRVRRNEVPVFEAQGLARKPAGSPHRFVVFGDGGAGTYEQYAIAFQAFRNRPDYVFLTGDVVYMRGRVSEYMDHFFPAYNSDAASSCAGAPLMRSTLFLAAAGNHDLIEGDLDRLPDAFAYFYYWDQPRNGPRVDAGHPGTPGLKGNSERRQAFLKGAGDAFPRMSNYSFNYGDVHWTVLDSNPYVDWVSSEHRAWLEADLMASQGASWRIVAFHHPPFSSSKAHKEDQRLRVLAPVFEAGKVTLVFNGHVHNYQRSLPLRFSIAKTDDGKPKPLGPYGQVEGTWVLDAAYDGKSRTRPDGVIYVITGAGGARLYDPGQTDDRSSWQSFTQAFVSNIHSLTVVDVTPERLTLRQVSDQGSEIDRFVITR